MSIKKMTALSSQEGDVLENSGRFGWKQYLQRDRGRWRESFLEAKFYSQSIYHYDVLL